MNPKHDLIFHLKQGPVIVTNETANMLYIDWPFGVTMEYSGLWIHKHPLANNKTLLTLRPTRTGRP